MWTDRVPKVGHRNPTRCKNSVSVRNDPLSDKALDEMDFSDATLLAVEILSSSDMNIDPGVRSREHAACLYAE